MPFALIHTKVWPSVIMSIMYCCFDSLISTASFAFYNDNFQFNGTQLWRHLALQGGYTFVKSPFEFFPLMMFRSMLLLLFLFPLRFYSNFQNHTFLYSRILNYALLGALICNFSYSLVKLLAFSDDVKQLQFPGVWSNVIWNIIAFLCLYSIYYFCFFKEKRLYEQMKDYSANDESISAENTSYQQLLNGSSSTSQASFISPQQEQLQISTLAHIRCLLHYCWHYCGWLAVGFLFLIIYSVARIFVPLYTARVISNIVRTHDIKQFFESVLIMSILLTIATLFGGFRAGVLNYTTAKIERLMRRDLFRSVTSQEIAFFDQAQTGEVLSRLIADCETMSSTISTNVNILLRNGLMVLGSIVFMLNMSWRLTSVTLIVIPPIAFFTKLYSTYYDHLSTKTQECKANANKIAEEVVSSMRNVRTFACEHKEQTRFKKQLDETLLVHKKKSLALAGFQWVNEFANNCILVAILTYGGYLVLSNRLTSDQMFAFLLYQLQLGENFYMLNSVATGLMECVGASRKVFEYLERVPKISLEKGIIESKHIDGKIEFRNVNFAYPTRPNTIVLEDLSFTIQPGETIALVGPSGAGKSSIIALLQHFYEPSSGEILLDDIPIEEYEHKYFHKKVSLVSQEPTLYACSIRENILYGCDEEEFGMDKVVEAAKLANIHQFVVESEQEYETKCGEKGVQMSGGQKQRIAIARALIRRPAVLILDEATSALDAESEHVIQEAVMRCSEGRTCVLIAHRLSTVKKADRIFVLDGGKIIQIGNHLELMNDRTGLYHSLVKRQLLDANQKK